MTPSVHTRKNQNKLNPHHYSHHEIEKYQNRGTPIVSFTGIDTVPAVRIMFQAVLLYGRYSLKDAFIQVGASQDKILRKRGDILNAVYISRLEYGEQQIVF